MTAQFVGHMADKKNVVANPTKNANHNNKVPAPSGAIDGSTVNGSSAKGSIQGSPSGKLAAAPAGKGGDLGGKIPGFGSGSPDSSTINGKSANGADQGSISGHLAAQPASKDQGKHVQGFSNGAIKNGKI